MTRHMSLLRGRISRKTEILCISKEGIKSIKTPGFVTVKLRDNLVLFFI